MISHKFSSSAHRTPLLKLVVVAFVVLFLASSVRHALFQSTAYDLGWFDQLVYLISRGKSPIVSFSGYHLLGDHAAVVLYPLGLFYWIYPDVHWLFLVQALALASSAILTYILAQQRGCPEPQAYALAVVYLLYPLVFNVNLFDFHPEVLAIPGFLGAVWAAKSERTLPYCFALLLILSCKAVLSLPVIFLGIWLLLWEKKRIAGSVAIALGTLWFILTTQIIIPHWSGQEPAAISRYAYLGNSIPEILLNLFVQPQLILQHLLTLDNFFYLFLLFLPLAWGISPRHLAPLIPALPVLLLNVLSQLELQKDLIHQYSVPILPFLLISVMDALAGEKTLWRKPRWIILWAILTFIALGKFGFFWTKYLTHIDTWQASRTAVSYIQSSEALLTTTHYIPHLSHRSEVALARIGSETLDLDPFTYVLLNLRHPGIDSAPETVAHLKARLQEIPEFHLQYEQDDVVVFAKVGNRESGTGGRENPVVSNIREQGTGGSGVGSRESGVD
ncbi:DUF2079 domain-containing protein [Spirulina subsalsa]|uniref:DUF2079 domain-containing protein n=1 Tax=Spirulina subsalsa TaxID=54311 RepID=UPI000313A9ED|nr:DUF2079 domain-containing protein [Spirulina subsalsa]